MTNSQQIDRVRELRAQGCAPRQIARAVGLRPAEVSVLLRQAAKESSAAAGPAPLVGCWVSAGWASGLTVRGHAAWPGLDADDPAADGLAAVLVARRHRYDKVSVCGYLVDVYCLGVKNALGPRVMDEHALLAFRRRFFEGYDAEPLAAPLDLAQQLVIGALDYARSLGFEPPAEYTDAAGHLGPGSGPCDIEFGRDRKPYFVQGPYDDPRRIMRTLDNTVGQGNYHYLMPLPVDALGH